MIKEATRETMDLPCTVMYGETLDDNEARQMARYIQYTVKK